MNLDLEVNTNLQNIVNKYINSEEELELEAIINKNITSDQFNKLLGVLKYRYPKTLKKYLYLNIYNNNTRVVINSLENIKEFYKNEDISNSDNFLYKEKLDEYKDNNYNIKFNLKTETEPTNLDKNIFKDTYKSIEKVYRYIERYSFICDDIRFDISLVKHSTGLSITESNIFFQPIKYELELEYINKNTTINNIIKTFYQNILFVIQVIDNTPYPLRNKEQHQIYNEYMKLVGHSNIGPRIVGMAKNTIYNITEDDLNNNKYMITAKADGERYILFINKLGMVYLIDDNKNIIDTNLICNAMNAIIDGEFINNYNSSNTLFNISLNNTNVSHIFTYKAFDIYYLNGEIVYDNELSERLNLIKSIDFQKNNKYALDFSVKTYYNITDIDLIIDDDKNKKFGYNIDGVIYQPIEPYTSATIKNITNYRILKWKPEKYNSIDFLLNIEYEKGQIKIIFNSLYTYNKYNKNISTIKPFSTVHPYIHNIHLQYEDSIPITEENSKIENNTIVECRYEVSTNRWIYMRVRNDKTQKYQKGIIRSTANNLWIANDIFSSMYFPITIDQINNMESFKQLIIQSNDYYYSYEQNDCDRTDLQKFHNKIKGELINNSVDYLSSHFDTIKCLDLGTGRGGDIKKYINTNHHNYNQNNKLKKGISVIIGIEYNKYNIEYYKFKENSYGARARFLNICTEYKDISNIPDIIKNYDCYTLQGDLNLDVLKKNTKLILNKYDKTTFDILWNKYKLDKNPFELVISNFSFHYFVQDLFKYNNILKTVSNNLKDNGLFIVTMMDGQKVMELLKKTKKDTIDLGFAVIRKIDKIDGKKKTGIKIGIKLKTMQTEQIEYLVDFDTLIAQCNKHKLYLSSSNYITEDTNKLGYFSDIKFKYPYKLGEDKTYSYLHRYAIFQKNNKVVNKLQNIVKISKNNTTDTPKNNTQQGGQNLFNKYDSSSSSDNSSDSDSSE